MPGVIESRPAPERASVSGAWQLRRRGENYPSPDAVAHVLTAEGKPSDGTLGLFCDAAGNPAAFIFGYAPAEKGETIEVVLDIGGQLFRAPAVPYKTDHLFPVSRRLIAAIRNGVGISYRDVAGQPYRIDTSGGSGALAHAYEGCGPAADF